MSQDELPAEKSASPGEVWEQLDANTRTRVIDLFAHLAYKFVVDLQEAENKEHDDVPSPRYAKD